MRPFSGGHRARRPAVVPCPTCDGLAFVIEPCRCTGPDAAFPDGPGAVAYPDCELCRGAGRVAAACLDCRRRGRRRAQFVLTVANADTGAVASADVRAGGLTARPGPPGRWCVDLTHRVRELAGIVGAHVDPGELTVVLPARWRPDLPAHARYELEALALARLDHDPWRVWIGRTDPPPAVDPAARLARLCALADLLMLDLVVDARPAGERLAWDIRYELPGTPVPARPESRVGDLPAALARTTAAAALDGLTWRCRDAPAYRLRPAAPRPLPAVDVDRLARAVRAELDAGAGRAGAQAIWRDGRWWYTGLLPGAPADPLAGQPTRRAAAGAGTPLRRGTEPPPPSWVGGPLPERPCPDCASGGRLCACQCASAGRSADRDCAACAGAGVRPWTLPCSTCGGRRRVHPTMLVTLTDLDRRAVHLIWPDGDGGSAGPTPAGSVVRLPGRFRLGDLADPFGVRPEDLVEADGGHPLGRDLREGWVLQPGAGVDPVAARVAATGAGLPGGRLLVAAVQPPAPPLAELVRLALGLGLALVATVRDDSAAAPPAEGGWCWSVDLVGESTPTPADDPVFHPTLEAACAALLEYLDGALAETVPEAPECPVPAPSSPARTAGGDPVPALVRLARQHAGWAVTARFTRAGFSVWLVGRDGVPRPLPVGRDDTSQRR